MKNRAHRRKMTRDSKRENTLLRHGKPVEYERGRLVFAAHFTRRRAA